MTALDWALALGGYWMPIKDADWRGRALYNRHYSALAYSDGRRPKRFAGPGYKLCLMTPDAKALLVWRLFRDKSGQQGVNCAIFRNEEAFGGAVLSSDLILAAEHMAWQRWPDQRLYTYVNPRRVESQNPGYCFKCAGWQVCGETKTRKLIILEKWP